MAQANGYQPTVRTGGNPEAVETAGDVATATGAPPTSPVQAIEVRSAAVAGAVADPLFQLDASGARSTMVGPYRLERVLGRGGQGLVVLATDDRSGRRVALKLMHRLAGLSAEHLVRFRREWEMLERIDAPGTADVLDFGIIEGVPFLAMSYVEGQTLERVTARKEDQREVVISVDAQPRAADEDPRQERRRPELSEILGLVAIGESVAKTLEQLHGSGILHRDVKPGNVMVTSEGKTVLLDFGVARELEGDQVTLTRTGELFGTPAYMSPEQLTGKHVRLDARSDVYSLGATLYECVTGCRPFDAPTREGLYQAILAKDAPDPRRINPAVPDDLAHVLLKALEKDRDRRYPNAAALADDLGRLLSGQPVKARGAGAWRRTARFLSRHPALAAAAVALLIGVGTGFGLASLMDGRCEAIAGPGTWKEWARDTAPTVKGGLQPPIWRLAPPRAIPVEVQLRLLGVEQAKV